MIIDKANYDNVIFANIFFLVNNKNQHFQNIESKNNISNKYSLYNYMNKHSNNKKLHQHHNISKICIMILIKMNIYMLLTILQL